MAKRSTFERNPRDYYVTPAKAVIPLLPHLPDRCKFIEPCAGDGSLVRALEERGHRCVMASDIEPRGKNIAKIDALDVFYDARDRCNLAQMIITNTPWRWAVLKSMLDHFIENRFPAWLLLPSDFAHNVRSVPFMHHCERYLAIGRVSWMGNAKGGHDNASWYLFNPLPTPATLFFPRVNNDK